MDGRPGKVYRGTLRRIAPSSNVANRAINVEALFPKESGELKSGFFGKGAFMSGTVGRFFHSYGQGRTRIPGAGGDLPGAPEEIAGAPHRWVVVALTAAVLLSMVPLAGIVGKDFLPYDDQSKFEIFIQMPEGYSLETADTVFREVEADVRGIRGVKHKPGA